ncbi:MAG: hypothetical protein GY719_17415 [bacterium]|nr:hypothetical protein [bacterium]
MIKFPSDARANLDCAFDRGRLTLYLGAGASAASGLPTWERLVLAMYFDMLSESNRRAYSNYVHAVAEWMLQKSPDPLEITAQKIRIHFGDDDDAFLESLKRQLYGGFHERGNYHIPRRKKLRGGNPTLRAVAQLVERSSPKKGRGVEAIITYNYDDLLEIALNKRTPYQVVHQPGGEPDGSLPIYHVHGFVPIAGSVSSPADGIIFTEEQYHEATNAAYTWSNLVQLRGLSSSTGLMVGLSLSDRNIRRLLHALSRSPVSATCYAILQRPTWKQPHDSEVQDVADMARELYESAKASGSPVPPDYGIKGKDWRSQVTHILDRAQHVATEQQERVLRDLGVIPIWYDNHDEVAEILREISPR